MARATKIHFFDEEENPVQGKHLIFLIDNSMPIL
jgi:hypothetical protein